MVPCRRQQWSWRLRLLLLLLHLQRVLLLGRRGAVGALQRVVVRGQVLLGLQVGALAAQALCLEKDKRRRITNFERYYLSNFFYITTTTIRTVFPPVAHLKLDNNCLLRSAVTSQHLLLLKKTIPAPRRMRTRTIPTATGAARVEEEELPPPPPPSPEEEEASREDPEPRCSPVGWRRRLEKE